MHHCRKGRKRILFLFPALSAYPGRLILFYEPKDSLREFKHTDDSKYNGYRSLHSSETGLSGLRQLIGNHIKSRPVDSRSRNKRDNS